VQKQVLILGGGFGGLYAALGLERTLARAAAQRLFEDLARTTENNRWARQLATMASILEAIWPARRLNCKPISLTTSQFPGETRTDSSRLLWQH
jgi:NADH dehydrogenase FAD-containing subunit